MEVSDQLPKKVVLPRQSQQPGCGATPPTNEWGTGFFFFPSVKQLAFEIDHFQLASGKVRNEQSYISTPHIRLHDIFNIKVFFFNQLSIFLVLALLL
jgi:hypothetical protein